MSFISKLVDENVYYNANVVNKTSVPTPASWNANHGYPIVQCPRNYSLSIIRFYIPGSFLPIFIWDSIPGPMNIQITVPGFSANRNVAYLDNWNTGQEANPRSVWSYGQFLFYMNETLRNMWIDPLNAPFAAFSQPIFWFDTTEQLFKIRFLNNTEANSIQIAFNGWLQQFFPTFPYKRKNSVDANVVGTFEIFYDENNPDCEDPNTLKVDIATEDNCQYAWNGLVRILIQSGTLNTRSEFQYNAFGNNNLIPIITDFEPSVNGDWRVNNVFQYVPQGELRRVDLLNPEPLTKVDFIFLWEDKWGGIYPLILPPGGFLSLKLLFQKK